MDLKKGESEKFALFLGQTSIVLHNLFTWVPTRVYSFKQSIIPEKPDT